MRQHARTMASSHGRSSAFRFLFVLIACVMAVSMAIPGTAEAKEARFDNCGQVSIHDITGELINAGIIYRRDIDVPSGYTNGNTTIDFDSGVSFYNVPNTYLWGNRWGGRIAQLAMDCNRVRFGVGSNLNKDSFTWQYLPQGGIDLSHEAPIWYAIKKNWFNGGDNYKGFWMGARCMHRVFGYRANDGVYVVTNIVSQTKCTGGPNNYGQWPTWHVDPTTNKSTWDLDHSFVWWPNDGHSWGWEGGRLFGGTNQNNCPGHWFYTYDVNTYVNGNNVVSNDIARFDVDKNGTRDVTDVGDYYSGNGIREGTKMLTHDVTAKDGYKYVGDSTSYEKTVNDDTEVKLQFKTRYSIDWDLGKTTSTTENPDTTKLIWDDNVKTPSLSDSDGRDISITYDSNDNDGGSTKADDYDRTIKTTLTADGWEINGHTYGKATTLSSPKFSDKPNGKVTATAHWTSKTFTPPTPTRTGYTFMGWYDQKTGGTKIDKITVEPGKTSFDKTYYAHWEANTYTLTYDKNNPSTASVDASDITVTPSMSQKAKFDSPWGTLSTASKPGYVFLGWYTKPVGGEQVTSSTIVKGDLTVYAHWRPIEYTIRFNPNAENGEGETTGTMPSIKVKYDQIVNLPANQYKKTVKAPGENDGDPIQKIRSVFKGWNYDATSLTSSLADKAAILNLTKRDGDVIDLYAIWDDAPKFVIERYPDRYFTLDEAKSGKVTEEELLSTVVAKDREMNKLEYKTSDDVKRTHDDTGVTLVNYDSHDFTDLTDDATVSVRYKVKDKSGTTSYLNIKVHVTRNGAMAKEKESRYRSISSQYLDTLPSESHWSSDELYKSSLDKALKGNQKSYSLTLHGSDIKRVQDYVKANGFGNSSVSDALSSLMSMFRNK